MPRYKLTVEYDGTPFAGWQRQPDQPSVQQSLEEAIGQYAQCVAETVAAGRTDAGVHAFGQVVHVDIPQERTAFSVRQGINFYLVDQALVVREAEQVSDAFHARFGAKKRYYTYRIVNRPSPPVLDAMRSWHLHGEVDIETMREAAQHLIGHHDFTSFRASECQSASPVKSLDTITITQEGEHIAVDLSARSFLHHQVRNIVGTLALVGAGKWQPARVKEALEARDRRAAGPTAPAHGLYFMRVEY